jgi:antirestriction protein ArdC
MEELVAELGSAFLSADLDLTPELRGDHASYISSWIKVLKDDKRAIFTSASHAQRAADFLHGLQKSASAEAGAARAPVQPSTERIAASPTSRLSASPGAAIRKYQRPV